MVCAKAHEINASVRFRSYLLPTVIIIGDPPTITQVALATCASSGMFAPITVGVRRYVDGGLGANNPVDMIWREAINICCPEDGNLEPLVQCLVSIGSGKPAVVGINDKDLFVTAMQIAEDTEQPSRDFTDRYRNLIIPGKERYFRLNVAHGLQEVGLDQYEKRAFVESATEQYLADQNQVFQIQNCARKLLMWD